VKAHDNLEGNERADHNAKGGARGSRRHGDGPPPTPTPALHLKFTNVSAPGVATGVDTNAQTCYTVAVMNHITDNQIFNPKRDQQGVARGGNDGPRGATHAVDDAIAASGPLATNC